AAGEDTDARVTVSLDGLQLSFDAALRMVRSAGDEAGLEFTRLPDAARELLQYVSRDDEEPASVVGALDRIEPPPPPRAVDPPAAPARRVPVRLVLSAALGVAMAAWLATTAYHRVWRIEVDAASIVAPTARVTSPSDGVLRAVWVAPGEPVEAGAPLFHVESPRARAEIEAAALAVQQAELEVARLEAARDAHAERLSIHDRMMRSRVAHQHTQVALLEERLALADGQLARLRALLARDVVSRLEVDVEAAKRAATAGELEAARSLLTVERGRLGAARQGWYFDGDRVEAGLPELDAALATAREEVALRRGVLEATRRRAEAAERVTAPFAGRVAEVTQTASTPVRQGVPVVVLEEAEARVVEAWITREEGEYVRIGDVARVTVSGLGARYEGTVRAIDSDAAKAETAAVWGMQPRLRVELDVTGLAGEPGSADEAREQLREAAAVGLPAVVSFARSWR
ncbi:MAG: HlyD family secretion protein, partial [Myxococcota bacterium]